MYFDVILFKHALVVADRSGYSCTCLLNTSKHTKMYLFPNFAAGKEPYKSTLSSSPGLSGRCARGSISRLPFGEFTCWQVSQ
jgi:hypothetical protein